MAMFKRWFVQQSCSTSNTSIDRNAVAEENTTNEMAGNSNSLTETTGNSNMYGARSYSMTERSHTCTTPTSKAETEMTVVADQIEMKKVKIKKKRSFYSLRSQSFTHLMADLR